MSKSIPTFPTQLRGLDRVQVIEYIARIHAEVESVSADRERLSTEIVQLRGEIDRLSGPIDSVEGMSDRIARMMRIASDEARRTKAMAYEEAETLTGELEDQLEAARQDHAAASAALNDLQATTAARREQILTEAKAEAEEVLQTAYNERARLAEESEEAERQRRESFRVLAEDDERRRQDAQRRLDQQIRSAWEQAEVHIGNLEKDARLRAAAMIADAEHEAQLRTERTEAQVKELLKIRGETVTALGEIQSRIETAVRRDRISVVKMPAVGDDS